MGKAAQRAAVQQIMANSCLGVTYRKDQRISKKTLAETYDRHNLSANDRYGQAIGMVLGLMFGADFAEPDAVNVAAGLCEVQPATIRKYLKWHKTGWGPSTHGMQRRGPRPKIQKRVKEELVTKLNTGPLGMSVRAAAIEVANENPGQNGLLKLSDSTLIRAIAKDLRWQPVKLMKGLTDEHMRLRAEWCAHVLNRVPNFSQRIFFTDSKYFRFDFTTKKISSWSPIDGSGRSFDEWAKGSGLVVHAYAGICFYGMTERLIFVTGTKGPSTLDSMPAPHYRAGNAEPCRGVCGAEYATRVVPKLTAAAKLLFPPEMHDQIIFQQDRASPHMTPEAIEAVTQAFRCSTVEKGSRLYWPSRSPDLSLIEHIWAQVEHELNRIKLVWYQNQKRPDKPDHAWFHDAVQRAYGEVCSKVKVKSMFRHYNQRLRECRDRSGAQVR